MYLGQNTGMSIWAGSIYVRIQVCGYELSVSRSGCGSKCLGCLYLGQDRSMKICSWLYLVQDRCMWISAACM
jgi:hypothetical protein